MKLIKILLVPTCLVLLAIAGCSDNTPTQPTDPDGPSPRTWNVPAEVATIAAAADSARQGDVIVVAPGVYLEHGIVLDIGVDLRGSSGKSADVVIDGQSLGRVLAVQQHDGTEPTPNDTVSVIADLVLTGGNSGGGGGLLLEHAAAVTNVRFVGNTASGAGGGVLVGAGAPVTFTHCAFDTNSTTVVGGNGGGLALDGSGRSALFDSCDFSGNTSLGHGGGLWVNRATAEITHCAFRNNRSNRNWQFEFDGGGLYYGGIQGQQAMIDTCVFDGNSSDGDGGGLACSGSITAAACTFLDNESVRGGAMQIDGDFAISACTFRDNVCEVTPGDGSSGLGGALKCSGSGTITDCEFTRNTGGLGSAIFGRADLALTGCTFAENVSTSACTAYWLGDIDVTAENCTFADNGAVDGGVFKADGAARVQFNACTLTGNTASRWAGAGWVTDGAHVTLTACTITGNTAALGGAFFLDSFASERSALALLASTIASNTASDTGGAIFVGVDSDLAASGVDFFDNAATSGPCAFVGIAASAVFTCCEVVQEEVVGPGTITFHDEGCE